MKKLVLFISILTIIGAIRVPNNWNDIHSASVTVAPLTPRGAGGSPYIRDYNQINSRRIKPNVPPEELKPAWSPGLVKRSTSKPKFNQLKPKYYKKHNQQFQKKKRFSKPGQIGFKNYDNKVPYITHKKSNNLDTSVLFPPRPLSTFANVYPQIKTRPNNIQPLKIQSFNQNTQFAKMPNLIKSPENIPIVRPILQQPNYFNPFKINSNLDSKHVQSFDQPRYQSDNPNSYEPNKNIINYFAAVKNEDFTPVQPHWGDKTTYSKVKEPRYQNNYQAYYNPQKNEIEYTTKEDDPRYYSHLYKNYREDETFEPEKKDEHYIKGEDPKLDREEVEKPPLSSHEIPKEIPTRPIYPGEGLWATPGLQHRPFISQQIYETLKEDEVKPKGYETFTQGQNLFNSTGQNLIHRFRAFPEQHKLGSFIQDKPVDPSHSETKETETAEKELIENKEENKSNGGEEEESEEDEFVPTRLYSQVRATEDKEYLPLEEADDGKLREAIKESKIHTVYTEEGYEDSAYDHAGHEKEAENDEGFEDLQREKQEKKEKLVPKAKLNLHLPNVENTKFSYGGNLPSDEEIARLKEAHLGISDTDSAGTRFEEPYQQNHEDEESQDSQEKDDDSDDYEDDYEDKSASGQLPTKPKQNVNNFMSTKETKTMTTKQKDDGDTETEISSKVKIILQPNNSTKSQEYVKIYPKVYKTIRRKKPTEDIEEGDEDKSEEFSENGYPREQNKPVNFSEIFIEEIIPTTEIPFTKLPPTEFEDLQEEIPITTLPTTAIPNPIKSDNDFPKNADEALENISKEFLKSNKRIKRFTNDFSDLKVENEFVPKISHQLGKIFDYKKIKYPYYDNYKEEGLNIDSPLRYSENMKNMPNKTGKKMIFYEQAEKIKPCPEIEATLNPIPEKVLNAENKKHEAHNENEEEEDENENVNEENEDETQENDEENQVNKEARKKRDVSEQQKTSRLSGLGDQIDCLKVRYFGENPLDSPFFDEVTVGTIEPIFKELNKANEIKNRFETKQLKNLNDKLKSKLRENNSEHKLSKKEVDTGVKAVKKTENKSVQITTESEQETTTSISLLTTPYYTIDLKPKHIYHQIELLEYLPNREVLNNKPATKEVQNNSNVNSRRDKSLDDDNLDSQSSINNPVLPEPEELIRRRKVRRRKPAFQIFDVNKFLPTTPPPIIKHPIGHGAFKAADNGAYMTAVHIPFKPANSAILETATPKPPAFNAIKKLPGLQIFDVNKFVPTTPSIYKEIITSSTVLPKYKVISEVFYKDDIKPNEQLNVFTDILNNIKNSSPNQTQLQHIDTADEPSEPVIATVNKQAIDYSKKRRTPQYYQDSYLKAYGDQEIESDYTDPIATTARTTTTTTTLRPTTYRGRFGYKIRTSPVKRVPVKNSIDSYEQKLKLYIALQEAKKKQNYAHINNNPDYDHTIPVNEDIYDYVDKTTKVMGLMPPGTNRYKTIHHPKRDNTMQISNPSDNQIIRKVNKFYVPGMKPPPHQRVLLYSDYLNNNLLAKKVSIRRGKRSTDRSVYSSLSGSRGKQDPELEKAIVPDSDDDDYVPHRSKNYYFDEKTGKIVYLTTKKPKVVEEEEEEIEYEEIIEETPSTSSKPKPKQDPIFATATPPPEGKGYLDFILKLKQNPNYTFIPDPTTTEKGIESVTDKTITATLTPQSTTPPEFLNILSKVRQNNQYKFIEDKKETVKKPTTPDPEDTLEDDDELEDEDFSSGHIQNSPGGFTNHETTENFGIFDVTEFIPKIKNYIPRTSYDTSKYKTISRPTAKPTAADEEEDENQSEEQHQSQIRHPPQRNIVQEYNTEEPTTERTFLIITEDGNHKLDSLNEATVTKQTEQIPVTLKRRRSTTTTSTSSTTHSTDPTEKPTTRATFLRRRRPTTLRSSRTTTSRPVTSRAPPTTSVSVSHEEKIRRVFRRRPPTKSNSSTVKYLDEVEDDKNIKVLRRRSGTVQQPSTEPPSTPKPNRFIETFKKFHRNKKHGGNYRSDDSPIQQSRISKKIEPPLGEISEAPLNKDVEVIGEYDKTKRHGGNYRRLEGNEELIEETQDNSQDYDIEDVTDTSNGNSLRISLLPKQEDDQELEEHVENGGNDDDDHHEEHLREKKEEEESEKSNKEVAIIKKKSDKNSKGKYVTEATLSRLTDVVPKPEAFYSDPTLPKSVNNLALANRPSSAEIKDILNNADSSEINVNRQESLTTKRPLIIKDPSKRFYFYAPI